MHLSKPTDGATQRLDPNVNVNFSWQQCINISSSVLTNASALILGEAVNKEVRGHMGTLYYLPNFL